MTVHRSIAATLCAPMLAVLALASGARAADHDPGRTIAIEHPWSRPTPPQAPTAVGYLTIVNRSGAPDRLIAVSSSAATQVSVHTMSMAGGVMRMRPVAGGLPIPATAPITLGPDGKHLMFVGLKRPFRPGERIPVTLTFEHAGKVGAELVVQKPDAAPVKALRGATTDAPSPAAGMNMRGMAMPGMDGR
ncbi:MAG TPA: copper chaperone PCu(A)C [Caulobacteraceae bacterium]|nr:copper chaperone PCu(A)C [Caulobacteraceae bacterium]